MKHQYKKVKAFWLPTENHTESLIRLGGRATLSIEYRDYKITQSEPGTSAGLQDLPSRRLRRSARLALI